MVGRAARRCVGGGEPNDVNLATVPGAIRHGWEGSRFPPLLVMEVPQMTSQTTQTLTDSAVADIALAPAAAEIYRDCDGLAWRTTSRPFGENESGPIGHDGDCYADGPLTEVIEVLVARGSKIGGAR